MEPGDSIRHQSINKINNQYQVNRKETFNIVIWVGFLILIRIAQVSGWNSSLLNLPIAAIIIYVSIRWPVKGFAAVLCLTFLGEDENSLGITFSLLIRIALVTRFIFDILLKRNEFFKIFIGTSKLWVPFFGSVVLSFFVNSSSSGIGFLIKFILTFILVIGLVPYIKNLKNLLLVQLSLVLAATFSGGWSILEYFQTGTRTGGLMGNINYTGMYLAVILFLSIGLWDYKILPGWLSLVITSVIAIGVITTVSRGGIIIILMGLLCFFILSINNFRKSSRYLFFFIFLFITGFIFILNSESTSRLFSTFSSILTGGTTDPTTGITIDRIVLWNDAIRLFKGNPILGVGPMNYLIERQKLYTVFSNQQPHMYIAQIISELGLTGIIAYSFFVLGSISFWINHLHKIQPRFYILASSWASAGVAMVSSTFSGYAYDPFIHIFMILAGSSILFFQNDKTLYTNLE